MCTTDPRALATQPACYGPGPSVRYLTSLVIVCVTVSASGCVVVKAHQRGNLAKRSMTNDRDPGEARFNQHAAGSREGADGGTGQPGGGCGCN